MNKVSEFLKKAADNEEYGKKVSELISEDMTEKSENKMIEIAKKMNITLTHKDFDEFFSDRELALEELEMVAGGIGFPNFKLPFRKVMK